MTDLSGTYLADPARLTLLADYFRHEAGKVEGKLYKTSRDSVARKTSGWHAEQLERLHGALSEISLVNEKRHAAVRFLDLLTLNERWALFHAVSWGCLTKELVNCVGHPSFRWVREQRPLGEALFESKVGPLNRRAGAPPSFLEAVEFLGSSSDDDEDPHPLLDPLIGRQEGLRTRIHDGNGRLLSCAYAVRHGRLSELTLIDIWVGHDRRPQADDDAAYGSARRTVFAGTNNSEGN